MPTKPYISKSNPKVLVIGHDPRLQKSDTIAEYSLFADYYFRTEPESGSEKRKFGIAKAVFDFVLEMTNRKISVDEICVTNLCNENLPHAPKGKTVYIPEEKALKGIKEIKKILTEHPTIKLIFTMSLQVNYWLQKLNFYNGDNEFINLSEPFEKGIKNPLPYFEPKETRSFLKVCGNEYKVNDLPNISVFPVLHIKSYPLKGKFITYEKKYNGLVEKISILF